HPARSSPASRRRRPEPLRQIAAICGILLALALARFWSAFFFPAPLGDELVYDRAFARAAAGGSPYEEPGSLSPPAFARLGAALRAAGGPMAPLYVLRGLNLGGLL